MSDKRTDEEKYPGRVAHGETVYAKLGEPMITTPRMYSRGSTVLCGRRKSHTKHLWTDPYSDEPIACPGNVNEVRITDPVTGGQKGMKPERYSLIPTEPLAELARVYGYGADKYEPNNWRKGYAYSLSLDALYRHIAAFRSGEAIDPESGRHHLGHAAFHLMTLMEFDRLGLGTDDRGAL